MIVKKKDVDINDFLKSSRYNGSPVETKKTTPTNTIEFQLENDDSITKLDIDESNIPLK